MFTYKVVSDFRHTYISEGKKYLVNPGEIIKSKTPLSYVFLQQIDNDVPVSDPDKQIYQGSKLSQQVVNTASAQAVSEAASSISDLAAILSAVKNNLESFKDKYDKDMQDITEQINKQFSDLEQKDTENKKSDDSFKEIVNRRLNILKDAVRTIEDEIFGAQEPPKV